MRGIRTGLLAVGVAAGAMSTLLLGSAFGASGQDRAAAGARPAISVPELACDSGKIIGVAADYVGKGQSEAAALNQAAKMLIERDGRRERLGILGPTRLEVQRDLYFVYDNGKGRPVARIHLAPQGEGWRFEGGSVCHVD